MLSDRTEIDGNRYAHRATGLANTDPLTDREVLFDGDYIARIRMIEHGPSEGEWHWNLQWHSVKEPVTGRCPSLDAGLAIVKERHRSEGQPMIVRDPQV